MKLELLRLQDRAKEVQKTHPVHQLLAVRPNDFQTPAQFKRQMICHALLWGNGRAYIRRENGVPVELIPLMPDRTQTAMVQGEKWHGTLVAKDDVLGNPNQKQEWEALYFPDSEVLHIPGLGYDGITGKSLISLASQTWSASLGLVKQLAKQQKKGYGGGLMLEAPVGAFRSEADAKEFLKNFRENHEGVENQGKIGMLRDGVKANVMAMSNSDAEFIAQWTKLREETALLFCLEGILGDNSNASYNSLEQKNLAYRVNCLSPWTVTVEEECNIKLLTESERRRGYMVKFDDRSLLRMDSSALMSVCSQAIASEIWNPNECRELFDYNPREGGDEYANPAINKKTGGASNQPNNAIAAVLGNLIAREQNAVLACVKSPQFITKVEEFYARWEPKLADAIEQLGGDRQVATDHCAESRRRLLEACECQPDELAGKVGACVESWPSRVHQLIEELSLCCK